MLKIYCVNDMAWRNLFQAIQMSERAIPFKTRTTFKRQVLYHCVSAHGWRVLRVAATVNRNELFIQSCRDVH